MPLFRKRDAAPTEPRAKPRFGAGRRLESDRDSRSCLSTLVGVLDMHAPTRYRHMPTLNEASVVWHGDKPLPAEAWTCSYGADDIFVFLLWPLEGGTRIGMFPLGGSEESLNTPLIGQWKTADPSLKSIGLFEPRQLTLLAPELNQQYYEGILKVAEKPCTTENITALARQVAMMFSIKAQEFMSKDPRAASRFVHEHPWTGDIGLPERILDDLGNWNNQVLPYIQDLPGVVRGILLEPGPDGHPAGALWQEMR